MLISFALAISCSQQFQSNLPPVVYELPIVGGQREVVLGPKPAESMLLNGYYEKEVSAKHVATGDNTGGYVDSWVPGGTSEENLGYFDCSTRSDNLFGKPCMVVTTTAKWNQRIGKKQQQLKFQNYAKQQWWVAADGKILRNYSALQTPEGMQSGDCTYGKDSLQRRYTSAKGETTFGEIFPACGMEALNDQFKPMIVDGKMVLREKEFYVANPLTGGLDKYYVRSAGTFRGELMNATFKGRVFEINGPNKLTQKAFIDDSGDLVRVNLTDEKYFVISVVPSSHLDQYGHPIRRSGGG